MTKQEYDLIKQALIDCIDRASKSLDPCQIREIPSYMNSLINLVNQGHK